MMGTEELDAGELDATFVPRFRNDIQVLNLQDESVMYQEDTSWLHQLDPIASAICACFDGRTSIDEAVDELAGLFSADRAVVEQDVLTLVRQLGRLGLLQGVQREAPDDQSAS